MYHYKFKLCPHPAYFVWFCFLSLIECIVDVQQNWSRLSNKRKSFFVQCIIKKGNCAEGHQQCLKFTSCKTINTNAWKNNLLRIIKWKAFALELGNLWKANIWRFAKMCMLDLFLYFFLCILLIPGRGWLLIQQGIVVLILTGSSSFCCLVPLNLTHAGSLTNTFVWFSICFQILDPKNWSWKVVIPFHRVISNIMVLLESTLLTWGATALWSCYSAFDSFCQVTDQPHKAQVAKSWW